MWYRPLAGDRINFYNRGLGHPRTICDKLFSNRPSSFWQEGPPMFSFYMHGKSDSAPWRPCFSTGQIYIILAILAEGHTRTIYAKLFSNRPCSFWQAIFSMFSLFIHGKYWLRPLPAMFFQQIKFILAILVESHQRTICIKLFSNLPSSFCKKIFKVLPFGCHGNQNSVCNDNFLAISKGEHPGASLCSLVKFCRVVKEILFKEIVDRRWTDWRRTS